MAILRFLTEALSEGVVFNFLKSAWHSITGTLKGGVQGQLGQIITERIKLGKKSLDDESIFGYCLGKADMKKKTRLMFHGAMAKLTLLDKSQGTHHARNFRIMIALDSFRKASIKNQMEFGLKEKDIDNMDHSGIIMLEDLAKQCKSEAELMIAMMAIGALADAPMDVWDHVENLQKWSKQVLYPAITTKIEGWGESFGDWAEKREGDYKKLPRYRKILLNFLD